MEDNLFALHHQLADKTYKPDKYDLFYVKDPKLRPIHKAKVKDRVIFQAVFRVLYHIFDRKFIFDSYSCRFNKGTHLGVSRLAKFARSASQNNHQTIYALKCDIKKFFYSVDHNILLDLIKTEIADTDALDLIEKIIGSFYSEPPHPRLRADPFLVKERGDRGLPLGNVTSQLFANVYLNELDQFVKHELKAKYYIRYCDDFIILHNDRKWLEEQVPKINDFSQNKLSLALHPDKVSIKKYNQGIDFLGYIILPHHIVLRMKTKQRMVRKLKQRQALLRAGAITRESFDQSLQSYLGVLKHCKGYNLGTKLMNEVWLNKGT
ncbi:MAG: group II intron reverse transcriptase domain-containing protein [Candidatus Magasanikbacteria bacterium]|nr:group II intron reverse transcriptase domain-containing protein [Candidatus Magasanikbacteria bacterium]